MFQEREDYQSPREANQFNALRKLKELGIPTPFEYARELQTEVDQNNQEINAGVFWVRFPPPEDFQETDPIEGKIYAPKNPNGEAVLFVPGHPGGKSGRFERRYAKRITDAGYTLIALRHNSTSLELEEGEAQEVINCPPRQQEAKEDGQKYFGPQKEEGYTWNDLIEEPISALVAIAPNFEKIHLVGHSFGAISQAYSLSQINTRAPAISEKIGNFVCLAGNLGYAKETADGRFPSGIKLSLEEFVDIEVRDCLENKVNITPDRERFKRAIIEVSRKFETTKIPESVGQIFVVSPEDRIIASPLIRLESGQIVYYEYPGHTKRSLYIEDYTHDTKHHSLPNLRPETLMRLIKMRVSSRGPHSVRVFAKEPKQ